MKLESLLALYLYQNKKLNLPGIGTFEAEGVITVPDDNDKHPVPLQGLSFKNSFRPEPDDDLIDFIKKHTGKMKPLAISDLESYLMLSKQFLNIGKPFYIEGIGTLQKVNDGSYKFTPGEYASAKLENPLQDKATESKKSAFREERHDYSKTSGSNNGLQKALLLLILIATALLIGWGGYYLYKSNTPANEETDSTPNSNISLIDSADNNKPIRPDSAMLIRDSTAASAVNTATPGSYKFVFETTDSKKRALTRLAYVNEINKQIRLETKADSSSFKLFVILPATPADTSRIKDSLNAWYYGKKEMKISIEQ